MQIALIATEENLLQFETMTKATEGPPRVFSHRVATEEDFEGLRDLMDASMRVLLREHLSAEELAASFSVMGLDTQLIEDRTYFIVEEDGRLAGSGGWSRRATLYGGDHTSGRSEALLDPVHDAARVRAMYTHPDFARRGVGRLILSLCEAAAIREGFRRAELAATMAGIPLYLACGYVEEERYFADTPSGVKVPLARMTKTLAP